MLFERFAKSAVRFAGTPILCHEAASQRMGRPIQDCGCLGLVGVVHGFVEGVEEGFVFFGAVVGGEAQGFHALGEDLGGFGLGSDELRWSRR